jgi:hypothetical protein
MSLLYVLLKPRVFPHGHKRKGRGFEPPTAFVFALEQISAQAVPPRQTGNKNRNSEWLMLLS